jgi:hypothetical protein
VSNRIIPLLIILSTAGSAYAQAPAPAPGDTEAAPVELGKGKQAQAEPPPPPMIRKVKTVWAGWTFGSGYGYHGKSDLETQDFSVNSGFGPGYIGHFGAEIGYQYTDQIAFALQGRHQVIPRKDTDPTRRGDPHQWAHTLLVRGTYMMPFDRFQMVAGGVLGAGSGFRFRIDPQPGKTLSTSDTVRGGPVVVGPTAGVIFPLAPRFSLVGDVRLLFGLPTFGAMADLNVGLQFDIFDL